MASYFRLTLDTTAPSGVGLTINNGAVYTTSAQVTLAISCSDADKTGYQMKIWGIDGAASEATATWETYSATKTVTLTSGDGNKTVYVKIRDDVYNESIWNCDVEIVAWKVKVVDSINASESDGTQIGTTGGSTNVSGNTTKSAETNVTTTIYGADLEAASAGDGEKILKIFVQNAAGSWSN